MKKGIIGIVMVLFIGAAIFGLSRLMGSSSTGSASSPQAEEKTAFASIQDEVAAGKAVLYDVRTHEEFITGHFSNSVNFPLITMQAGQLPAVEKSSKIYLYCRSGNRSAQARDLLERAGYSNVTDLKGLRDVESLGGTLSNG